MTFSNMEIIKYSKETIFEGSLEGWQEQMKLRWVIVFISASSSPNVLYTQCLSNPSMPHVF